MGVITFNGTTSTSINLQVETPPDYEIPERSYETTPIPGRNGDVVMDTGAYKNVEREYVVSIGAQGGDFATFANTLSGWLNSAPGYLRLEDSYEPLYFKMARYSGSNSVANILQQAGRATLKFDRKPQRFLKTGETPVTMTASKVFTNPTNYPSKPLIKVIGTGSGTVVIGSCTITITNLSAYMYIDCDLEDIYKDAINMNNYATLSTADFPVFGKGNTTVTFSGNITSLEVTPRWWLI